MIRHIVFFTLRDGADPTEVEAALRELAEIPAARRLDVRRNLRRDRSSNEIDLVVYGEFDDTDALARYHADPRYQRAIEQVRPRRELRFAADIEA